MNFSNDDFIRTTEPRHVRSCQALWSRLKANGEIYLGSYAGWYSVRDEAFYGESELVNGKAPTGINPTSTSACSWRWLNWYSTARRGQTRGGPLAKGSASRLVMSPPPTRSISTPRTSAGQLFSANARTAQAANA